MRRAWSFPAVRLSVGALVKIELKCEMNPRKMLKKSLFLALSRRLSLAGRRGVSLFDGQIVACIHSYVAKAFACHPQSLELRVFMGASGATGSHSRVDCRCMSIPAVFNCLVYLIEWHICGLHTLFAAIYLAHVRTLHKPTQRMVNVHIYPDSSGIDLAHAQPQILGLEVHVFGLGKDNSKLDSGHETFPEGAWRRIIICLP